ncbi:MAG: DUF559 domain-containing protein [Thermoleophilaceae bacterium]
MVGKTAKISADTVIARVAAPQDGVVSRAQLREAGLTARVIDRRVQAGTLRPVHRGVYAVGYRGLTRSALCRAAVLAGGPTAALSHRDAGSEWGMIRTAVGPVSVTVPGTTGRSQRRTITLCRGPLPPTDVVVRSGFRITSPARTLIDLAALLSTRELERALDEAHYLNRLSARTLAEAVRRNRGRPGTKALRRALANHELGSTRTETALEERFLMLIRAAGLPQPRCQVWIGPYRVDFLWPAQRLIVEADGERSHHGRRRQARDARRDAELDAKGYVALRLDEAEVDHPEAAVTRVAEALSGRINLQATRPANSASARSSPSRRKP